MKPPAFTYHRPTSVAEALATLADLGADGKVLAGGQSLVPLLNMRLAAPAHLVDINRLGGELGSIEAGPDGVVVGALARHADSERSDAAAAVFPLLREATRHVAHPTIRNRGTTVGSLAHADPASELPGVLTLCGGTVRVRSATGTRVVAAADFFVGPLESALRPGELAVSATFPAFPPGTGTAWAEVSRRAGDYALCGLGIAVTLAADLSVEAARAAYISVGLTPVQRRPDRRGGRAALRCRRLGGRRCAGPVAGRSRRRHPRQRGLPAPPRGCADRARRARRRRPGGRVGRGGLMAEELFDVALTVNGIPQTMRVPPRRLLSDALRHDLALTGTHVGCEHGVCGACTVLLDGQPVRSCLIFAVSVDGASVTTMEGCRAPDGELGPVQRAFMQCHGLQCGFCTPGFVTTITAYLREHPDPTAQEAREAIGGNLCRCTGYQNIVSSVLRAAEILREEATP